MEKTKRETKGVLHLTQGNPLSLLIRFSLPLIAGTIFQQLYSFVDTIMVGRLVGQSALAAVGTTYSLNFLIIGFVQGACVGFAIPLAKKIGARGQVGFQRYFWNGCWISIALALILGISSVLLSPALLQMIQTPADILKPAAQYIQIIFFGIPFTVLFNYGSAVLRASGDSKRPTLFLLVSSFLNIILDYICIALLDGGIAGAAWATVLSQGLSGGLNFWWIFKRTSLLHDSRKQMKISTYHLNVLMKAGLPMGFEYSISALGAIVMQSVINSMGSLVIAGQTTGEKIRQMLTLPMESVGMAMATYAGQNDGAGKPERIAAGIKAGLTIQLTYCAVMWVLVLVGRSLMTDLVLGPDGGQAAVLSNQYLMIMSCLFCLHGSLMIMRNTLQGMGYTLQAVLSGIGELAGRAVFSWLAVRSLGFVGIALANPAAWLFALIYCSIMVTVYLRPRLRTNTSKVSPAKI